MIYSHIHTHQWQSTARTIHGSREYRCWVCGDRAYGFHPSEIPPERPMDAPGAGKRTDFPLSG